MLKTLIARTFYPYDSVRTVQRGPLRGYKFLVKPSMGLTFAWDLGSPEKAFLANHVSSGETVYDVGANRGQFALLFSHLVGDAGTVVSFEPIEKLADTLRENVGLNDIQNVQVVTAAASAQEGTASFAYSDAHSTQGMLRETEPSYTLSDATTIEVRTVALDELVRAGELPPPDVLKIDVEGGAGAVLAGSRNILDTHRPNVYVELHGPEEQQAVKEEIAERGYTIQTLDGTIVEDPTAEWRSPLWCPRPDANQQ